MSKGSAFERALCKQLSEWWSSDIKSDEPPRDDIFWRTDGSGGRATTRAKTGKSTFGQSADIQANDPVGQPLLDFMLIEVKRGYNKVSPFGLLDRTGKSAVQTMESWLFKQRNELTTSMSVGWSLIHKRDQREPYIILSSEIHELLNGRHPLHGMENTMRFETTIRNGKILYPKNEDLKNLHYSEDLLILPLDLFLEQISPLDVIECLRLARQDNPVTNV